MDSVYIPASLQSLWNMWNIRGFMIMSLCFQLVLALVSPLRKKTSNFIIISIIWSAYFLADWTAIYVFGLISNAGCNKSPSYVEVSEDLLPLWASFLLIHLGGPDTITAFSLEDNALWLRHLVGLIAQVFAFFYIFVKTLPNNKLMGPVVLIFTAGVIKYGERTRALKLASLENIKESTIKWRNLNISVDIMRIFDELRKDGKKQDGKKHTVIHFFHIFKGLIVHVMPNHTQWVESRDFFLKQNAESAFELITSELTLLYENLYTKIMAARSFWGVIIRNLAFYLSITALVLFCINEKDGIHTTDIWITYALLAGAIALDSASDIILTHSKWDTNYDTVTWQILGRCVCPFLFSMMMFRIVIFFTFLCGCGRVVKRPWSDKVGSLSVLVYSFEEGRPRSGSMLGRHCHAFYSLIVQKIGIVEAIANMRYTSKIPMDKGIWNYTFCRLTKRADAADKPEQVKEMYEARGEFALRDSACDLKRYVSDLDYDQSVLFWHIATEISYNIDYPDKSNEYVKFSKTISDYMIYLLVKQPDMTSTVAGMFPGRYRNTCSVLKGLNETVKSETLKEFSRMVLDEFLYFPMPEDSDENAGQSVLIDSCQLVNLLRSSDRKWEVICEVWVELLSYAAGHCPAVSHARLIREGGEFVTFVWLLMAHLGIGPHFPKVYRLVSE